VAEPKNGKDLERRIAEVNGSGPLFWRIAPGDDYPRQLKDANRELRELTGLRDIRPHDLRRTGRTHVPSRADRAPRAKRAGDTRERGEAHSVTVR
jgi:hypothetical protein